MTFMATRPATPCCATWSKRFTDTCGPTIRSCASGGDEFVCALGGSHAEDAALRFEEIRRTITNSQPEASISVGFAELGPQDTIDALMRRGDAALYEAKYARKAQLG
ncbi:MAG: hypothetical protein NVS1B9_11860 [Solirubrobacteraceae bacterium]